MPIQIIELTPGEAEAIGHAMDRSGLVSPEELHLILNNLYPAHEIIRDSEEADAAGRDQLDLMRPPSFEESADRQLKDHAGLWRRLAGVWRWLAGDERSDP